MGDDRIMSENLFMHFKKLPEDAKAYLKAVKKHLCLPPSLAKDALRPLIQVLTGCQASYDALVEDMGTPKAKAEELNRSVPGYLYRKSQWRRPCMVLGIFSLLRSIYLAVILGLFHFALTNPQITFGLNDPAASVAIIGGADGPTAIYVTSMPQYTTALSLLFWLAMAILGFWGYYHLRHVRSPLSRS